MSAALRPSGDAVALHVERSGHGAPVVLWHGWAMNLRVFDALRENLQRDFQTIAVDLPGHGRSAWRAAVPAVPAVRGAQLEALDSLLQALLASLPQDATLVGWSLGGQLALRAAMLAPERVARLVLIATTPRLLRADDWPHGVDPALLAGMRARLQEDSQAMVDEFLELQLRGCRNAVPLLHALRSALPLQGVASAPALLSGLEVLTDTDLRPLLSQVHQPALVVGGQYDRITHPRAAEALAHSLSTARYHEFARSAHAPFLSHADEFIALLREFIAASAAS
jgi:pimeloyl-[acyl-carrier protein] methyl ester esterase